jgi:hypothetical protein
MKTRPSYGNGEGTELSVSGCPTRMRGGLAQCNVAALTPVINPAAQEEPRAINLLDARCAQRILKGLGG